MKRGMRRGLQRRMKRGRRAEILLAIDQGTTGTKAFLLRDDLRVLGEATREFPQHFPKPGWVEHDLEKVHASVAAAVKQVFRDTGVQPSRIAGVGITNQRETTAVWDRSTGRPIHRAIVWQDRRTADACAALRRRGLESKFRRATGLVLDPYFSGTKLAWLLDHVAGARAKARAGQLAFGTIDSFLAWRLTGGASHVTDTSNASRTLLLDLAKGEWSEELCDILRVPLRMLPRVIPNDEVLGRTRGVGFLPDGIPVACPIGDQQSALFGQACYSQGEAKCTYGTGAFLVLNTGDEIVPSRHGLIATAAWRLAGKTTFALEGSTFIAGAIVQWLRDGLGIIRSSSEIEALAQSVDASDGVVLVPALTGLGAPHWDPHARGVLCGLTRGSTRAHVARAALEGIAFQIHDLLRAMEKDVGRRVRRLKVDGGASRNNLLLQFQSDLLGARISRPQITSTTALGAALLAGHGLGIFTSLAQIRKAWAEERSFRPLTSRARMEPRLAEWRRAVQLARSGGE